MINMVSGCASSHDRPIRLGDDEPNDFPYETDIVQWRMNTQGIHNQTARQPIEKLHNKADDPSIEVPHHELGREWAISYLNGYQSGTMMSNMVPSGYKSSIEYIPDIETAIAVAVSIWNAIYGTERINRQSPYFAYLIEDYWVVTGSLPEGALGGSAKAIIQKSTGEILQVLHSQ